METSNEVGIKMRKGFLLILSLVFCHNSVFGQSDTSNNSNNIDSPQSKPSTGLNANIYEKDPNEDKKSFSAKVKLIREMEDIEVFFEGKDKGPYLLKEGPNLGLYKERLIKSQKAKNLSVNVKIEKDYIVSVELPETKEKKEEPKSDVDSVLDSVFKK